MGRGRVWDKGAVAFMEGTRTALRAVVEEYALSLPDAGPQRLREAAERLAQTCRRLCAELPRQEPGAEWVAQQLERAEQEALRGDLEGALARLSLLSTWRGQVRDSSR